MQQNEKQSNLKRGKGLELYFSKNVKMANHHRKRCSTSLVIRKWKQDHRDTSSNPLRRLLENKQTNKTKPQPSAGMDLEESEPSDVAATRNLK